MAKSFIEARKPNSICLKSGRYLDFADPKPEQFTLWDIAYGLTNAARFSGQLKDGAVWNVAQHSMLVAMMSPLGLRFAALLHDASEAFTGDMPSPLKKLCPDFCAVEKKLMDVICQKYGANPDSMLAIKPYDIMALKIEKENMSSAAKDDWGLPDDPKLACYATKQEIARFIRGAKTAPRDDVAYAWVRLLLLVRKHAI